MGSGEFFVKYILFFANLFFSSAGLALLGLGIAVQLRISVITDLFEGSYSLAPILSIVVGAVIFFIAFLGCCGAIRESNCLLVTYAVFMIILMILKLTFAILLFVNLNGIKDQIQVVLEREFSRQPDNFNNMQAIFQCCGANGPSDYGLLELPKSCCPETILGICTKLEAFNVGCTEVLTQFFDVYGTVIGAVAIVIVFIESGCVILTMTIVQKIQEKISSLKKLSALVAVVFGLCLVNHARNKNRRSKY